MDFVNIDKNLPNGENMGGLTQTIIFGLWDDVAQWPTEPTNPTDVEDYGEWVGDVIMKPGKKAFTFYSTEDTAGLNIEPVGEIDGMSFQETLDVFNPGLKKKLLGFIAAAKNENLFFIAQDSEGQYYLLGDSKRAVKMIAGGSIGTGLKTADRKGAGLKFVFKTNVPRAYIGDVSGLLEVASA
jgi:hypothetical protein